MTRFTHAEAERAYALWGCNCGPAALAAVLDRTLDEVRPLMGDFETKGYTNPSLMKDALYRAGAKFRVTALGYKIAGGRITFVGWPKDGLARIQWEGPWCDDGVPMAARYRHTHWVGARMRSDGATGIFDVNCMNNGSGWVGHADWQRMLVPHITRQIPRASGGFHITHAIEVAR